jgi:hypothetical protein
MDDQSAWIDNATVSARQLFKLALKNVITFLYGNNIVSHLLRHVLVFYDAITAWDSVDSYVLVPAAAKRHSY